MSVRAALNDHARSAYTGLIEITEQAPFSEAYQQQRNLLLSSRCRADSIPELEIHNDEVQCSHGSTSTSVDEEQLFYCLSRGLSREAAVALVVKGFLRELIESSSAGIRDELEQLIDERLVGWRAR